MNQSILDLLPYNAPTLTSLQGWPISVLDLSKIHPLLNGNKYFKLMPYLQEAKENGINTLITYGGAYSNHLRSFALACNHLGFYGIAVVRGDELDMASNERLASIDRMGVKLHFVSRNDYSNNKQLIAEVLGQNTQSPYLIIPEGGTSAKVLNSCAQIAQYITHDTDYVMLPVGSGGTLAGILMGLSKRTSPPIVQAFGSFSNNTSPEATINKLLQEQGIDYPNWSIDLEYKFGGFGKAHQAVSAFQEAILAQNQLALDTVYNAKALLALTLKIQSGALPLDQNYVYINTGGMLQI